MSMFDKIKAVVLRAKHQRRLADLGIRNHVASLQTRTTQLKTAAKAMDRAIKAQTHKEARKKIAAVETQILQMGAVTRGLIKYKAKYAAADKLVQKSKGKAVRVSPDIVNVIDFDTDDDL